jgi:Putative zinc-finger
MNCQEAIERLPWWLNGSLEPEERREVDEHLAGCATCREALEETRLAWTVFAQHLPTEALVAMAADEPVPGIAPEILAEHLAECPQCAAELELARSSRLLSEHGEVPILAPRPTPGARRSAGRGWLAAALAAGLALATTAGWLGSVRQTKHLEARLAAAARPAASAQGPAAMAPAGFSLNAQFSADAVVRDGSGAKEEQSARLPRSGPVTILLNSQADFSGEHAYKLFDAKGTLLASVQGIPPNPYHAYFVTLDAGLVPPGTYKLRLYSASEGENAGETFSFRIVP